MKLRLTALVLASLAFPLSLMTACGDSEPVEDEGVGGAGGEPGCPDYLTECSASCVNTDIDPAHCGECGTECGDGTACVDGACVPSSCRDGQVACGDECVTLARDPAHCGDCDTACESGEACNQGVCVTDCGEGLLACEGSCVNPQSDPVYCGATACGDAAGPEEVGTPCSPTQACVAGVCQELEPQWSTAGRIDTSDYGVDTGENGIAADGQGNAWAVWRQGTDTPTPAPDGTQRVFARYYDAASRTWLEPVVRLDEETARPRNLRIAMNAAGDVAVVWASADQLVKLAYKAVGEAAWQPPVTVSTSTPLLGIPDVTVAGDGTAWIAWAQVTGPTDTPADTRVVFTRSYDGTALGSLQQMPSLGLGHSYNADIEANQAGDLALIWEEDVSATTGDVVGVGFVGAPRITRRPASTGIWDAPFDGRVNQVASRVAYRADIAIAGGGLILATWTEYDTGLQLYRAQTKVFDGTAWEITTAVDGSSQSEDYPTVSLNEAGDGVLVYAQDHWNDPVVPADPDECRVKGRRYSVATGWQNALEIDSFPTFYPTPYTCQAPISGIDAGGRALAAWYGDGSVSTGWRLELALLPTAPSIWQAPVVLSPGAVSYSGEPWVAVGGNGMVHATWVQGTGALQLVATVLR